MNTDPKMIEAGAGSDTQPLQVSTNLLEVANVVPEPTALVLLGVGLVVVGYFAWRSRQKR